MKAAIIYNPNSGKHSTNKKLEKQFLSILREKGYEVEIYITEYHLHAKKIIQELSDDIDLVLVIGGDGTLNEAITGNCERVKPLLISPLPLGTTNDVCTMLGYGKNIITNLQDILNGVTCDIDIFEINGHPFIYVAGFGKFMNVPYDTKRETKKKWGYLAYVVEAVKSFFDKEHLYELTYEVDGETYTGLYSFISISNASRIAGFNNVFKNVKLNDGKIEVLFCNIAKKKDLIKSLYFLASNDITNVPGFYFHRTDKLKITFKKAPKSSWCIDGEKLEEENLIYEILKLRTIKMRVTKNASSELFIRQNK